MTHRPGSEEKQAVIKPNTQYYPGGACLSKARKPFTWNENSIYLVIVPRLDVSSIQNMKLVKLDIYIFKNGSESEHNHSYPILPETRKFQARSSSKKLNVLSFFIFWLMVFATVSENPSIFSSQESFVVIVK